MSDLTQTPPTSWALGGAQTSAKARVICPPKRVEKIYRIILWPVLPPRFTMIGLVVFLLRPADGKPDSDPLVFFLLHPSMESISNIHPRGHTAL